MLGEQQQLLQTMIESGLGFLIQLHALFCQAGRFFNRMLIARQRRERGELRGPVVQGHGRMLAGNVMGQRKHIIIAGICGSAHAL